MASLPPRRSTTSSSPTMNNGSLPANNAAGASSSAPGSMSSGSFGHLMSSSSGASEEPPPYMGANSHYSNNQFAFTSADASRYHSLNGLNLQRSLPNSNHPVAANVVAATTGSRYTPSPFNMRDAALYQSTIPSSAFASATPLPSMASLSSTTPPQPYTGMPPPWFDQLASDKSASPSPSPMYGASPFAMSAPMAVAVPTAVATPSVMATPVARSPVVASAVATVPPSSPYASSPSSTATNNARYSTLPTSGTFSATPLPSTASLTAPTTAIATPPSSSMPLSYSSSPSISTVTSSPVASQRSASGSSNAPLATSLSSLHQLVSSSHSLLANLAQSLMSSSLSTSPDRPFSASPSSAATWEQPSAQSAMTTINSLLDSLRQVAASLSSSDAVTVAPGSPISSNAITQLRKLISQQEFGAANARSLLATMEKDENTWKQRESMLQSELAFYRSAHSLQMAALTDWLSQCEALLSRAIPAEHQRHALGYNTQGEGVSNSSGEGGGKLPAMSVADFKTRFQAIQAQYDARLQSIGMARSATPTSDGKQPVMMAPVTAIGVPFNSSSGGAGGEGQQQAQSSPYYHLPEGQSVPGGPPLWPAIVQMPAPSPTSTNGSGGPPPSFAWPSQASPHYSRMAMDSFSAPITSTTSQPSITGSNVMSLVPPPMAVGTPAFSHGIKKSASSTNVSNSQMRAHSPSATTRVGGTGASAYASLLTPPSTITGGGSGNTNDRGSTSPGIPTLTQSLRRLSLHGDSSTSSTSTTSVFGSTGGTAGTPPVSQYALGLQCEQKGLMKQAFEHYKRAAFDPSESNADAAYKVGLMYLYGLNATQIDYKKGVDALEVAVKLKANGAVSLLATCWWNGWGVQESGINAARMWSGLDDMYSQLHYAVRMRKGDYGVERNIDLATNMWDSAFPILRSLADSGDARAAHEVANWLHGFGNRVDACRYYQLAADRGHASAQNTLAVRYEKGDGVERDLVRASQLALAAAQQGLAVSQFNLANYYAKGQGFPAPDRAKARHWYTAAAQQGDPDAQRKLFDFID